MTDAIVHATCVAAHGRGVLIRGASGSGKSSLALAMMALGAELVADDRVILTLRDNQIHASAPTPLRGLIEARGIGLLRADTLDETVLDLVVELDRTETRRLPPLRGTDLLGRQLTLLYRVETIHFPAMLLQFLKSGRHAT